MTQFVELVLTCGSWQEAQGIAEKLLEKKLVACVEFFEVRSRFHWEGRLDEANEIKLIMHSASHLFEKVEAEVKALHSYDTFVLLALPVEHVSEAAKAWLEDILKD